MYECPNCGGNLRFDIPTQLLKCDYCRKATDPYSVQKERDAVESDMFDVTVFTCPQCGGEILSTDNTAAGFCSFCGASTILTSRISKEKRPDYIIPFQKTKEDCKQAYSNMMKHAIFAPKELKDKKCIDNFRGIYMPYWAYLITQNGRFSINGEKSYRRGDYIYTDHYALEGDIDAYYKGLSYDASSSFSDNISETIAPYDVRGMKEFTPSFFSGFYADTADVVNSIYIGDAQKIANDHALALIQKDREFHGYTQKQPSNVTDANRALNTLCPKVDNAMFPVWFLSYRKGDRVAYATVNGQTGKVSADLPVSIGKYLLFSIPLAVLLFFVLNLFVTLRPVAGLALSALFALVTSILYTTEIVSISRRENLEDDRGMLYHQNKPIKQPKHFSTGKLKKPKASALPVIIFLTIWGIGFTTPILAAFGSGQLTGCPQFVIFACMVGGIITCVVSMTKYTKLEKKGSLPGFFCSMIALSVATIIAVVHPISDIWYYGGTILSMVAVFFTLIAMIQAYNMLSTRRLPQFNRTGGDDRA